MAYTSEETVVYLTKAHAALVSGKETTAAAIQGEKDAIKRAEQALAIVEPLKAENSALQTLSATLTEQLNSSKVRLAEWEAQDAAEDEALTPLKDFLDSPPSQPETGNPESESTDGNQVPPVEKTADVEVPTTDGVDLTTPVETKTEGDIGQNDTKSDDDELDLSNEGSR